MAKYVMLDFEYNTTSEKYLNLVCCSYKTNDGKYDRDIWLYSNGVNQGILVQEILDLHNEGYVFMAHNVVAEGSAFYSMGLNPAKFKWVDTFAEYRCLSNHNHYIQYGEHLMDDKVKELTPPKPKWMQKEGESTSGKLKHSLAEACYKFLKVKIDTQHKNEIRDIIIRNDSNEINDNKQVILDYCRSDIQYLDPLFKEMVKEYKQLLPKAELKTLKEEMLWRGESMARTAIMERTGYPIDYTATKNFSDSVSDILIDIQKDINRQFPDMGIFVKGGGATLTRKEKPIREWIAKGPYADKWMKTDTGKYSLSLDAFGKHYTFRHSYPEGNLGAQMLRFLKTKQNMNGFMPSKAGKKKTFWDSVGSDGRVRPYLNPYGAQSARYQPQATGFLFLKAAWLRTLCMPVKGRMMVGIDYKSEEFLLSAILFNDKKMAEAYDTGDVYLAFGHDAGVIPRDGNKASHPKERQACKSSVLGISYLMSKIGLSAKLTQDLGREVTEEEAQEYIDMFSETYSDFDNGRMAVEDIYKENRYIKLLDGWYMWGDNRNMRSVGNVGTQGAGSCILRKAVQLCQDAGLEVNLPLHDALYIEVDKNDWESVDLFAKCMEDAFTYFFKGEQLEMAKKIMIDIEAWGFGLKEEEITTKEGRKVAVQEWHVDERSKEEFEKFSKYFVEPDWRIL